MRFRTTTIFVCLLLAAGILIAQDRPLAGQIQTNDGPTITFTGTTVSCSGLSPGDSVALVGFVINAQAGSHSITTPTISQTADAAGVFTATIDSGVKPLSIWLLIDETKFSYTVAGPEGSVLRQMPEGTVSLAGDAASQSATVTIQRAHTHVISVSDSNLVLDESRTGRIKATDTTDTRPPGFTVFDAKDGTAADNDGVIDGVVHLVVPSFLNPSQKAAYLFVVDDRTLEFTTLDLQFNTAVGPCRPGAC